MGPAAEKRSHIALPHMSHQIAQLIFEKYCKLQGGECVTVPDLGSKGQFFVIGLSVRRHEYQYRATPLVTVGDIRYICSAKGHLVIEKSGPQLGKVWFPLRRCTFVIQVTQLHIGTNLIWSTHPYNTLKEFDTQSHLPNSNIELPIE